MYLNLNLELIVRLFRNILRLNKYNFQLQFKPSSTTLLCVNDKYSISYKFFASNPYSVTLSLPKELVKSLSDLAIKSVNDVQLEIINKDSLHYVTVNEETFTCNEVDVRLDIPTESEESSIEQPLIDVIKSFLTTNYKLKDIFIRDRKVVVLSEDECSFQVFNTSCGDELILDWDQAKFIYSFLSKIKLDKQCYKVDDETFTYLQFSNQIKLSNKTIQPISVVVQLYKTPFYKIKYDHLNNLFKEVIDTKLVQIDKAKFIKKIEDKSKEEDSDGLVLLGREKKIAISDLKSAMYHKDELEGVRVKDDLVMFVYKELYLIYTLYLPGDKND